VRLSAAGDLKFRYQTGSGIWEPMTPAIGTDGTIYVGSDDNYMYAINPAGTLKWKYLTGDDVDSPPAVGSDGTIYFGSYDYYLYALNPDGTLKWKYETGDYVVSSPALGSDGTIYFGSFDYYLYALNADGTLKWRYETGSIVYSSPAIGSDSTIYVGGADGLIYALKPDGTLKWSYTTDEAIFSSPALGSDGTIYIGEGYYYEDNGTVYTSGEYFYALNPDGTLKWRYYVGAGIQSSPTLGSDGTIYFGGLDNYIYALNSDGTLKWEYETGGWVLSTPAVGSDGTIYAGSEDYYVYALNSDGTLKWRYLTESLVLAAPTIGNDGTVYIGSNDTHLYALESGTTSGLTASPWPKFGCDLQNTGQAGAAVVPADKRLTFAQVDATGFPVIECYVTVRDQSGNYITGLTAKDFTVMEDSVVQSPITVTSVGTTGSALTVVLVLDRSGSMDGSPITDLKTAAKSFVDNMSTQDKCGIVSFESTVTVEQAFTSDKTLLKTAIDNIYADGFTAMYDGAYKALSELSLQTGRRAVIVFGDGDDNESTTTSDQVISYANSLGISIFTIGLGLSPGSTEETTYKNLADQTNGSYFYAPSSSELAQIYQNLAEIFASQYHITYTTSNPNADCTVRDVLITATFSGGSATSGKSYTAPCATTGTVTLTCGSTSGSAGGTVSVSISLDNSSIAIAGGQFVLTPSPSGYLTFKSAAVGSRTSGWTVSNSALGDGQMILFYSGAGATISTGSGDILTVSYDVSSTVPTGTEINLVFSGVQLSDANQKAVTTNLVTGKITIGGCALPGDVNSDGSVNIFDVLTIVKFALGQQTPTAAQSACADMNSDGAINIFDVLACVNKALGRTLLLAGVSPEPAQLDLNQLKQDLRALGADQSLIDDVAALYSMTTGRVQLPESFSLAQNSPNPFNPATTISYGVPEGEIVNASLKIYDIRGRLVRTLAEGVREPGTHQVYWDGTDETGQRVASGIYIYRMRAGDFARTRKMVLLK